MEPIPMSPPPVEVLEAEVLEEEENVMEEAS